MQMHVQEHWLVVEAVRHQLVVIKKVSEAELNCKKEKTKKIFLCICSSVFLCVIVFVQLWVL